MGRKSKEQSGEWKLQMLKAVLQAKSMEEMQEAFGIGEKGVKWRLAELYKTHGVKNKYELMARYVVLPEELEEVSFESSKVEKTVETKVAPTEKLVDIETGGLLPVGNVNKTKNIWA
jgi:hypothetical protein